MKFTSDIDLDFADRNQILNIIRHVPASIISDSKRIRHNTGVYVTDIPVDPVTKSSSLDYRIAEDRGYIKLDFLNVHVYTQVNGPIHLDQLLQREPSWHRLYEPEFCTQLIHIGNHYDNLVAMPEAVNTIARLAMFLAVIRPAKRHLLGRSWQDVAESVWQRPADDQYYFKKSHSVAYAHLVTVHMNLLDLADQGNTTTL